MGPRGAATLEPALQEKGQEEGQCRSCDEASGWLLRDTLAEWLRRRPTKPMGSPRVGSNPTGVVLSANFQCICCSRATSYDLDVSVRVRICTLRYRTRNVRLPKP